MKKFLSVLIGAALMLAAVNLRAQAPTVGFTPLSVSNSTAVFTAGTINYTNGPLISLKQQNVAISSTLGTTATATNIYLFGPWDGVNVDTNPADLFGVTNATTGATPSETTIKNLNASGFGGLKLVSIITISGGSVTNTLSYMGKISTP